MPNLENLFLTSNLINNIDKIKHLNKLKRLFLENNQIEEIIPIISLIKLSSLGLSSNAIKDLSPLTNLNLYSLELNNNQITEIGFIKNMSNLRYLFLSQNQIENIDEDTFNNFKYLLDLDLSLNNITKIKLNKTEKIFKLNLSHNLLENIDFLFEVNLNLLKYLSLNNNKIRNISRELFTTFNGLTTLDISYNVFNLTPVKINKRNKFSSSLVNIKIDENQLNLLIDFIRDDYFKNIKGNVIFIETFYMNTINDLVSYDCFLVIDFFKKKILFNFKYDYQIEAFFDKCKYFELFS
jgi:Leucine-rich repeat (LRR) protein